MRGAPLQTAEERESGFEAHVERETRDDLRAAFAAHTKGQTHFTRRMAIAIGDHFGMSPMQVIRAYEGMGLLKRGSAEWFRENGGITRDHIAEARADRAPASS